MSSASSHLQWKYVTVTVAAKPTIVLVGNEYLSSQCAIIVGPKLCRAERVAPAHFCSPIHPGGVLADQRTPTGCMANTPCGGAFDLHLDHSTSMYVCMYVYVRICIFILNGLKLTIFSCCFLHTNTQVRWKPKLH